MKRKYDLYLEGIVTSINRMKEYITKEEDFLNNQLILDAVIRNLEIIGE